MHKDTDKEKNWSNVVSLMLENRKSLRKILTAEEQRIRIQFFFVYILLFLVAVFMTVMNVFTGWKLLMYSTLVFSLACLSNIILCLIGRKCEGVSHVLFGIEIVTLFTFFCICGEPEGFSAIWIVLLPTCGLLLYKLKYGTIISLLQFFILVFLFWTSAGNSLLQYEYTRAFLMRFPVLYFAFFAVGVFFELVLEATQRELVIEQRDSAYLADHDALTGLYNRCGFDGIVDDLYADDKTQLRAFAIADIDDFKLINDTYGHYDGDIVLKRLADTFKSVVGDNGKVCRWGGEEFSVLFTSDADAQKLCDRLLEEARALEFTFGGQKCGITVSISLLIIDSSDEIDMPLVFKTADANLYTAKNSGKNMVVTSRL